jgi:ABC-type lipoprotein export system ATPase subunit
MKAYQIGLSFSRINHPRKIVFHGLTFVLPSKGLVVITGDSGVGKTSLLSIISGQKRPTKGKIIFPKAWKKAPPVYLEDQLSLMPTWRIKDFIFQPETNEYLDQLGFPLFSRKKHFQDLSGGQKIRLMVALFFSQSSSCYLLDEPTHALDEELRKRMITFLTHQANHQLIVVATHDLDLIAQANHELNLISAFESKWKDHLFNAGTSKKPILKFEKVIKTHWVKKLFWLHRGHGLGNALSIASMMVHLGLLFTGLIHDSMVHQSHRYVDMERLEPFLSIQEVQQTDIHQSPFQLVKTQAPDFQQLSLAISMIEDARVITAINEWFPTTMKIFEFTFQLRFIDLPYQEDHISVMWIYPNISLPTYLELSSLALIESMPLFSYGNQLSIIDRRPIQSWFEPPQILLSYWQWFHLLQANSTMVNGEEVSFLTMYQQIHPPSSVMVYDPNGTVNEILNSHSNHHRWTVHKSLEKTYELFHLLLDSTKTLTQFLFISLWILGLFVWSTRLHWIYQNHQGQWRWLRLLHIPKNKIWEAISLRTYLSGFMSLAMVQWLFIFVNHQWHLIPGSSFITMLIVGTFIYSIQLISRYLMLRWYGHA